MASHFFGTDPNVLGTWVVGIPNLQTCDLASLVWNCDRDPISKVTAASPHESLEDCQGVPPISNSSCQEKTELLLDKLVDLSRPKIPRPISC